MIFELQNAIISPSSSPSVPESSVWSKPALLVGIRSNDKQETSLISIRPILRWGFQTCVKVICLPIDLGVQDTQCGFKLMTAPTAKLLYPRLHLKRWTHDVEMLYIAQQLELESKIIVCETEIGWVDKDGSKLVETPGGTIRVIFEMLWDILVMRFKYLSGEWKI